MKKFFTPSILIFIFILLGGSNAFSAGVGSEMGAAAGTMVAAAVKEAPKGIVQDAAKNESKSIMNKMGLSSVGDFFASSVGVAILAGISTVYSGMLYQAASDQEDEARDNIKKIDRIISEFKDSYVSFCPEGRDDLSHPDCYCYLSGGGQNPQRTNSKICQDLWNKNNFKIKASDGNYSEGGKFVDPVGCLTLNGQFDESCKCKKFLDSKGNNACAKGASIMIPNNSFGAAIYSNTALRDVARLAAGAMSGAPNFNSFNAGVLGLKAIQSKKITDSLVQKISSGNGGLGLKEVNEDNVNQIAKALLGEKKFNSITGSNGASALMTASSAMPADPKLNAALKAAATKANLDLSGSGKGLMNKKAESKEQFAFNLNADSSASNTTGATQEFAEVQKTYKINSDISKKSEANLFEIISNRYIQSGLKRLFEEN